MTSVYGRSHVAGSQYGLTVASAIVVLTIPEAEGTTAAEITVISGLVRFTKDGETSPSSTRGKPAYAGDVIYLNSSDEVRQFQFCGVDGVATVDVEYFTLPSASHDVNRSGNLVGEDGERVQIDGGQLNVESDSLAGVLGEIRDVLTRIEIHQEEISNLGSLKPGGR